MKVYGGTYDGTNRLFGAAKSWAAFHRKLQSHGQNVSKRRMTMYGSETGNEFEVKTAFADPEALFSTNRTNSKTIKLTPK